MRFFWVLLSIILCSQVNLAAFGADTQKIAKLDRPTLIFIESPDCPVCKKVRALIAPVVTKYESKIDYVSLKVTDDGATADAQKKAKELGVDWFLVDSAGVYPCVGVFTKRGRLVRELVGLKDEEDYDKAVKRVLKQ